MFQPQIRLLPRSGRDASRKWSTECDRQFDDDAIQNYRGEIDAKLAYRTWFFGHYHDDEWRDDHHRLIYRDIVPFGVRRQDEDREPVTPFDDKWAK
uniref:hypothetical protein n=1 Tax=Parolsenella massiliensis TaxID=1871022 RepID=UPI0009331138|nr:hypothetical protein [Parolsenella massiliensis]